MNLLKSNKKLSDSLEDLKSDFNDFKDVMIDNFKYLMDSNINFSKICQAYLSEKLIVGETYDLYLSDKGKVKGVLLEEVIVFGDDISAKFHICGNEVCQVRDISRIKFIDKKDLRDRCEVMQDFSNEQNKEIKQQLEDATDGSFTKQEIIGLIQYVSQEPDESLIDVTEQEAESILRRYTEFKKNHLNKEP